MSVKINWASRSSYVNNTEWDRRWAETFGGHSLKKGKKKETGENKNQGGKT